MVTRTKKAPAKAATKVAEKASKVPKRGAKQPKGISTDEAFDIIANMHSTVDDVEKKLQQESSTIDDMPFMSTGMLALDMLTGGIKPAWYTSMGMEQSSKTTSALNIMASAIRQGVPIISLRDCEGSTYSSLPYVHSITKSQGLTLKKDEIFGKKDENGDWLVRPTVRYSNDASLEGFFDYVHAILSDLPDKRKVRGQWWYRFDDNKKNQAKYGSASDSGMAKRHGSGIWIPAKDGKLQAVFLVDSYPAMLPTEQDQEEANNSLALQARAFSKHIPRVKGRLAKKMVAIIGINQLRAVPMAMFGPKENEPGGNALKLFSDVRIKHTSRALSAAPFKATADKDFNEQERSVEFEGGFDKYRYVSIAAVKNKLAMPGRKSFLRIWIEDGSGTARGLDPVFDTVYYLQQTGQLSGNRKKFTLNLNKLGAGKRPVTWEIMKKWVLGDKTMMSKISAALGYKPMSIRKFCFEQIASGVADTLFTKNKNSKTKDADGDSDDE